MLKDLCCEGCLHKQQGCDSFRVGMQVKNNLSITIPRKFFFVLLPSYPGSKWAFFGGRVWELLLRAVLMGS